LQDALRRDITINTLFYNINESKVEDFTNKVTATATATAAAAAAAALSLSHSKQKPKQNKTIN